MGYPNVNSVMISGRLVHSPQMNAGGTMCRFGIAVDKWKKVGDKWESECSFINCVAFKETAQKVADKAGKGMFVMVEGSLQSKSFEKDGIKRTSVEIVCFKVHIDSKKRGERVGKKLKKQRVELQKKMMKISRFKELLIEAYRRVSIAWAILRYGTFWLEESLEECFLQTGINMDKAEIIEILEPHQVRIEIFGTEKIRFKVGNLGTIEFDSIMNANGFKSCIGEVE